MTQKTVHLQDYLKVILRRRWVIISFFLSLVITVFIGSLKQKPIYQAGTTLLIQRESPKVVSFEAVTPMGTGEYQAYKDYYETQYKLIKSRVLLAKVVDSLGLRTGRSSKDDDFLEKFSNCIKVNPVKSSQLVEILVEYPDPLMAAKIADEIAEEYIRQNLERNINTAHDAAGWLSEKIEEQRRKVMEIELNLQNYRLSHNINVLPQMTGNFSMEDVKTEYAKLQSLLDSYSQRYTDEHPKVIELKAQIRSLKNKIQGLEEGDTGNKTMEYVVLERELQTSRQMYEALLMRMKEASIVSTLTGSNIGIIDRAQVPSRPIKPNVRLNMILAILVGLVMGTGLAFFVDYLDTTIKSPEDVKEILGLSLLGVVPRIEEENEGKRDKIIHLDPASFISEAYRGIRTDILKGLSQSKDVLKVILVTSAEPQAGKTTTVSNLGIALSNQESRVLLVDCDLRRPQLHKIFNLERAHGVSDYLCGTSTPDSIIKDTEIGTLKVVTAGTELKNPSELLSSKMMEGFISAMKEKFDFIVLDSPPVANITDSVILADKADASIHVVRSGKSFVPLALRTKELLGKSKANFLGAILNDFDTYSENYYYYRYYHTYYHAEGAREQRLRQPVRGSKRNNGGLRKRLRETARSLKADSVRLLSLLQRNPKSRFSSADDARSPLDETSGVTSDT